MDTFYITPQPVSMSEMIRLRQYPHVLTLSAESSQLIQQGRHYLEEKMARESAPIYGITTGFGALCHELIPPADRKQLQLNLLRSHACGTGEQVPPALVKQMLWLKIKSLAAGHSGVRQELIDRLLLFYNQDIIPVVYQQGSLGASGDLAPLAHLSLPLVGEGEVHWQETVQPTSRVLEALHLQPLTLVEKEGLALLNGTQFSTAYTLDAWLHGQQLADLADLTAALACDGFHCRTEPFDARIHAIRPHPGQVQVAANMRRLLDQSEIANSPKIQVQDPYAFRCIPQVHGATRDALAYAKQVLSIEMNAVTDNPNLFPATDAILSGGNFHAQPVALVADHLAIALSELGSISERRTYQLISGLRSLPMFLTPQPGLHSGLMIPQYTAASIVSQNKQLCTPASIDSIVSSNGQEDHVSMAANAATKLYRVVENVTTVLAIEFMTAAQALSFRQPARTSPLLEEILTRYRQRVPVLAEDRFLHDDIMKTKEFLLSLQQSALD